MSEYISTIGLEIHAELKTRTKMFCSSENDPDESSPNVNICPVCIAHPGTLPTINKEAVRAVLRVGAALGGKLADYSEFDRKNYFYPDLPKGYQISQYEYPLVSGGELMGIAITRIHLEEDTASSIHDDESGSTAIDFNRAGVPLMELVTDPVIKTAREAGDFARELQLLLRYLEVSDANMEKGELRIEANVSVSRSESRFDLKGAQGRTLGTSAPLGTKVEIKNLNSFRAMERAIKYEINRQGGILKSGGAVTQETRGWDDLKQISFPQRAKEVSADYRYFPDPDLPALRLSEEQEFSLSAIEASISELPWMRRDRYRSLGLRDEESQLFVEAPLLGRFFDQVITDFPVGDKRAKLSANYIANDLLSLIRDTIGRDAQIEARDLTDTKNFTALMDMIAEGSISSAAAKIILADMVKEGGAPRDIAKNKRLTQKTSHDELLPIVRRTIAENAAAAADYRAGKASAVQFLVGKAMSASRGSADPNVLRTLLIQEITS